MTSAKIVFVPGPDPQTGPRPPEIREVDLSYEVMKGLVGGYLECVPLEALDAEAVRIDMWLNEEGLLIGLPCNRLVTRPHDGAEFPIVGDFFIAGSDEDGETIGLTDEQATEWLARMRDAPVAVVMPRGVGLA